MRKIKRSPEIIILRSEYQELRKELNEISRKMNERYYHELELRKHFTEKQLIDYHEETKSKYYEEHENYLIKKIKVDKKLEELNARRDYEINQIDKEIKFINIFEIFIYLLIIFLGSYTICNTIF